MTLIIDYGLGNLKNIEKVLKSLGVSPIISNSISEIDKADNYILPGVGAFSDAMKKINNLKIADVLRSNILNKKKPILGICLGMQLIGLSSEENGETKGLGLLQFRVKKFSKNKELRLPHIGWNEVSIKNKESKLLSRIPNGSDFYFVHSYQASCENSSIIAATSEYGDVFASVIEYENIFATQFHPEKSQAHGIKILKNFIEFSND
jgi:imidazole glycerol-phosphate synthase subunit HisH